jgi:predicted lipoprotein with Yx(FWY)xxD motif
MTRTTRTTRISLALLIAVAIPVGAVAAEGSSTTSAAKAKAPALKLSKTGLGTIIVDGKGRTLYAFGHDLKNKSRCSGPCAQNWPPAAAPPKPAVAKGIAKSKLKVIKRGDGSRQLSYAGHPLYRFSLDSARGDTNGQNVTAFGGTWHALSKSGAVVTKAPGSSSTSSSPDSNPAPGGYYPSPGGY